MDVPRFVVYRDTRKYAHLVWMTEEDEDAGIARIFVLASAPKTNNKGIQARYVPLIRVYELSDKRLGWRTRRFANSAKKTWMPVLPSLVRLYVMDRLASQTSKVVDMLEEVNNELTDAIQLLRDSLS